MKWISLHKKLPPENIDVLFSSDEGIFVGEYDSSLRRDCKYVPKRLSHHGCGCCGGDPPDTTHWMPLPQPPKTKGE